MDSNSDYIFRKLYHAPRQALSQPVTLRDSKGFAAPD